MDTNPNFATILNALDMQAQKQQANLGNTQNDGLTMQKRVDNYNACTQLTNQGVYIPDLMSKINSLEEKLKALENNPQTSKIDEELFEVMESSVKSDPQVKVSKQKLADVKSRIINEFCIKDPRFKEAFDDYKRTVNAVYIRQKEQDSVRETMPAIRDIPEGSISHQEGVSDDEGIERLRE